MSGTTASWFGRQQAIKKAAGNAATKGTYASKVLASQRHHPLKAVRDAVDAVYILRKKGCSLSTPVFDASSPHLREQRQGDGKNAY